MKVRANDVTIWLTLHGRSQISDEDRVVLKPYREVVVNSGDSTCLKISICVDRRIFSLHRQKMLLDKFNELSPYSLTSEIPIFHSSKFASVSTEIPSRIMSCLVNIGAKVSIISYMSS